MYPAEKASSSDPRGNDASTVALLLRRYRRAAGLSQADLAERAGLSVGAIGSLEQGLRKSPYPFTLNKLADALSLTFDQRNALVVSAKNARARRCTAESASTVQTNVPVPLTSFVQRVETVKLAQLLLRQRLVTVTGPPGVGKTRTALQVVRQCKSSAVAFVDLSMITDDRLVSAEVASALHVPALGTKATIPELIARLNGQRTVLVLDCCERVSAGASSIVLDLLRACIELRVLVTSREPLGLSNEAVFRIPPLDVPPIGAELSTVAQYSALELFVARACTSDARTVLTEPDLEAAADICRRLDGIPLAIELAAGCVPFFGVTSLRDRLSVLSLGNGAKDAPERHQTMKAAIEWSFMLLNDRERQLMRRMSVFTGTFALEAAEVVCADEKLPVDAISRLIFELVRKSLVEAKIAEPSNRYYMLDSIRAYAASDLSAAGELDATAQRLAEWLGK